MLLTQQEPDMTSYEISNTTSGHILGIFGGSTPVAAYLEMLKDAGALEQQAEALRAAAGEAGDLAMVKLIDDGDERAIADAIWTGCPDIRIRKV